MKTRKKKIKRSFKLLTFALMLILLASSMPFTLQAMAIETMVNIEEVKEYREEYSKHFKMPDGTYKAVSYTAPVHRMDENGEWQDLENILSENTVKNKQAYVTADGRTVFSKKISADDNTVFELNDGGYSMKVLFENENIKNSNAKLSNHAKKYEPVNTDDIETQYKKLKEIDTNTTVKYKNILKNVDLEYILSANDIKENIIIRKACEDYEFSFIYELEGLSAILCENGSISVYDSETNEIKYNIPAPYMYDDDGVESTDVTYSLDDLGEGKYRLTVTPNEAWINAEDRAFPVIVDPTVTLHANLYDAYIDSYDPNWNFDETENLVVGDHAIVFMDIANDSSGNPQLPILPDDATITNAVLKVYYYFNVTTGYIELGVYPAGFDWRESTITWNIANQYDNMGVTPVLIDSVSAGASANINSSSPGMVTFDVTSLMQFWYAGGTNYGIAIKRIGGTNGSVIIKSMEAGESTHSIYEITYNTGNIPIENGQYFIRNGQLNGYISINDNASDYSEDGLTMELWELAGTSDQKWEVKYLHNGYYKITSVANQKVISVPSVQTEENNISLELEDYNILSRQIWLITSVDEEMLKLSPKSSPSHYMAASSGVGIGGRNIEQRLNQSGNSLDEWYFAKMLPLSGSEIAYEPSRWSGTVQSRTNCYAYAINNQLDKSGGLWVPKDNFLYQQPGQYAGNTIYQSDITTAGDLIVNAVEDDFDEYNSYNNADLVFIEIDKYDRCPTGSYKVALVVNPGVDYHWYRQDADGYWSHKQGDNAISRYDNSDNLIIDPEIADRGGYSEFIGFYAVMPWNDYYTSRMLIPEIEGIETETNIVVVNAELVQQITVGMTFEEVKTILGSAGADVGSGFIVYQYELTNNQTAYINYILNDSSELVVCNVVVK